MAYETASRLNQVAEQVPAGSGYPDSSLADRLRLATVDYGGSEPLQVVCGAPNVAAGQRVADLLRIDAGATGQRQRLSDGADGDADDHLVGALGDLSGANAANVSDVFPQHFENRQGAPESGVLGADHDGKRAGLRTHFAAGDGRIEKRPAALTNSPLHGAGYVGRHGRHIDRHRALP